MSNFGSEKVSGGKGSQGPCKTDIVHQRPPADPGSVGGNKIPKGKYSQSEKLMEFMENLNAMARAPPPLPSPALVEYVPEDGNTDRCR